MLHKTVKVKLLHLLKYAMIHHHQKNQSCKITIRQTISFISLNLQYNHQLKCSYSILEQFYTYDYWKPEKTSSFSDVFGQYRNSTLGENCLTLI